LSASPPGEESPNDDASLARRVAQVAGDLLLTLQRSDLFDGKALGRAGDRVANAFIMEALAVARPDDAILSEEEAADSKRLAQSRVWIVDPLDGTREFGERRTDWAVHIALAIDGIATLGAVALPGFPMVLATDPPPQVLVAEGPLKMLVSRTRPRPWRWCAARLIFTCTRAVSTSGTAARRWRWRVRRVCGCRASMARCPATTRRTRTCRIF
jgi:3'-phosphoadenosine 5'-phosphosulfate (PAPS) 3'-phosphatase